MAKSIAISKDGSWKIEVEVFSINLFVYQALGVTTRSYLKTQPNWWQRLWGVRESWNPVRADNISAMGTLGVSRFPGIMAPIPRSPNTRSNDSVADCRAWSIGIGITFVTDAPITPVPPGTNPSPGGGPTMTADRVTGSGSARRGSEQLSIGPLSAP